MREGRYLCRAKRKNWSELPRAQWWVEGYYVEFPVSKLQKSTPFNARVLTYDEATMWDEYRKIGTPEECLRNKDFLDFLSDEMNPNDFEVYLRIYNSLDEKGESHD